MLAIPAFHDFFKWTPWNVKTLQFEINFMNTGISISKRNIWINKCMFLSPQLLLSLPYDRKLETEADDVGLQLMAKVFVRNRGLSHYLREIGSLLIFQQNNDEALQDMERDDFIPQRTNSKTEP